MSTPHLAARLQGFGTTVFAEMSALAVATGSVNLGQGFPDTPGPPEVLDVARAAIGTGLDQYPPGPGLPVLREAIAAGGTSFDALYVNVNGESGYFDRSLHVYGREGLPCARCATPIRREPFMNRSSYSCPRCQPCPRPRAPVEP